MSSQHKFEINYLYLNQPRVHVFELDGECLPQHSAAMHLIELHYADAENSLMMPSAKASPDEIMAQAQLLGITEIRVSS